MKENSSVPSFVNGGTCVGSVDGTNSDVRSVATFIGADYERVTDETQRGWVTINKNRRQRGVKKQ